MGEATLGDGRRHRARLRRRGVESRADRVRERVDRERLATDGRRFEQRQPDERPLEPLGVCLDDPITLETEANERKLSPASRIPNHMNHSVRLATAAASAGFAGARHKRREAPVFAPQRPTLP